jgi:hypothetical protein
VIFFLGGLAEVQSGPQFYKYIVGAFALSHPNISFLPLGDFVLIKEKSHQQCSVLLPFV